MFVHTFNTWLLAQLLHPFVFLLYFFFLCPVEIINVLLIIMIPIVFFISMPSLLMARAFFGLLPRITAPEFEKLFIWIILVELSIFLNFSGLLLVFNGQIWMSAYELMIPSMIAAFFATLIRAKQFFSFQLNYKSVKNENSM